MANNRCFSCRVGNSATFLQMPVESQHLFFHLVLRADDDGIVELYPVVKLLGTTPDAIRVLIARGFIKFIVEKENAGVVIILDWFEHNSIRPSRKKDSLYLEIAKQLCPERKYVISTKKTQKQNGDNVDLLTETCTTNVGNDVHVGTCRQMSDMSHEGKLSKDKLSEVNVVHDTHKIEILNPLPESIARDLAKEFNCSKEQVIWKAKSLSDYCKSKKRIYADYIAFLSKALGEDYGYRTITQPQSRVEMRDGKPIAVYESKTYVRNNE